MYMHAVLCLFCWESQILDSSKIYPYWDVILVYKYMFNTDKVRVCRHT